MTGPTVSIPSGGAFGYSSTSDLGLDQSTHDANVAAELTSAQVLALIPTGTYAGTQTAGTAMTAANRANLPVNAKDAPYNATGLGVVNDTAAIQAALDAASASGTRSGVVFLPRGVYNFTQLQIPQGVSLVGEGIGVFPYSGTVLNQIDGTNADGIVRVASGSDAFHWSVLSNFLLQKPVGTTDTVGRGIFMDARTGEGFAIQHVQVQRFPEHGIEIDGGVPTFALDDLHLMTNGQYGLFLNQIAGTGRTFQGVSIKRISGDDNGTPANDGALIGIKNLGSAAYSAVDIDGVKSESFTAGRQPYVIVADDCSGAPIRAVNVSNRGIGATTTAVVLVKTSAARIYLSLIKATGTTNVIEDRVGSRTWTDFDFMDLLWHSSGGAMFVTSANNVSVRETAYTTSTYFHEEWVAGETNARVRRKGNGKVEAGSGVAAADTFWERSASGGWLATCSAGGQDAVNVTGVLRSQQASASATNIRMSDHNGVSRWLYYISGNDLVLWDSTNGADRLKLRADGDVELMGAAKGLILRSPDNTRYKLTVPNGGASLTITAA